MAGFQTNTTDHVIRSNLWSSDLKMVLEDELAGMKYVDMITDFPDGDTWNIPSLGQAEVLDYDEGQAVRYTAMDTGNFTFTIDNYKSSATYVTNKMKQDSMYMDRIVSQFVPKQNRAIMAGIESNIMALGPNGQTASDPNTINGVAHRAVATGSSDVIALADIARARFALKKANVPDTNLIGIVDPSVEYTLNTLTGITGVSNNPRWEGIVSSGIATGMKFLYNIYGFDIYVSNYLKSSTTEETISGTECTDPVYNIFFSAASDVLPFVGAMRQAPTVDSEYNKDLQRDEYVTTCRYGFKLFRPENMYVLLTNQTV